MYYDSAEGIEISRKRAEKECREHNIPQCEMEEYLNAQSFPMKAQDLLDWLGY